MLMTMHMQRCMSMYVKTCTEKIHFDFEASPGSKDPSIDAGNCRGCQERF